MGGLISKPKVPDVPEPPAAPEIPQRPKAADAAAADTADKARKQAQARAAANRQLLTGSQGVTAAANTGKVQLGA